jgi:hypothetical protein
VATFSAGKINWSDGSVWKTTMAPAAHLALTNYSNAGTDFTAHVIQNGTPTAVFVNASGMIALGNFTSGTTAIVAAWGNDVGTFTNGNINWSDGTTWSSITLQPLLLAATDTNGAVSHVQFLSATTLIALDGPMSGLNGARQNGQIVWSNGTVWDGFDFNALNALFQTATGYP